jgi:Kdo2-lipid IVA lauroyltransferase/acyltransferase
MIGSRLLFWLVIKPVSLLPYPLLYALSDFFYFILYYLVGYRKAVSRQNIKFCFPEKTEQEIDEMLKKFYRHFCDLVLESLKNFSITKEMAQHRMEQHGTEILNQLYDQGRSVILAGGHYGNWELWATATPPHFKHRLMGIYKRLNNAYFDQKMRESRGKFGLELVSTKDTGQFFKDNTNSLTVSVFAVDQSPSNPKKAIWIKFFGRETAALFGSEKYAVECDNAVVWAHIRKTKRGFYTVTYELVTTAPRTMAKGELTQKLHDILEKDIREAPEYWLWSHKRWKHQRPADADIGDYNTQ